MFPADTLGAVYYGYPEERWVDFRQLDALKPMIDERLEIGSEWSEWVEERHHSASRKLLHASRLQRNWASYLERYGPAACDMMLGDCLWHVYAMIGKLTRRVYLLSADRPDT